MSVRWGSAVLLLELSYAVICLLVWLFYGRMTSPFELGLWLGGLLLWIPVLAHLSGSWWTSRQPYEPPSSPPASRLHPPPQGIDVFVTVCGEPLSTVLPRLLAAREMRMPHLTWVLDDGGSLELEAFCKRERLRYLRRDTRAFGKAGNVNHALQFATGEFVAVFDADQCPDPAFLERTLGHFQTPSVAFVQTPQCYERSRGVVSEGARQAQAAFFRFIMPGKAHYHSAICLGTNVIFRRSALDAVGGLYQHSQSEDVHTSRRLHSHGWTSVFVPEVLASGLAPHSWNAYLSQQQRWSRGGFEILFSAQLWRSPGLSQTQRWQYALVGLHYLTSVVFLLCSLLPVLNLLWLTTPLTLHPSGLLLLTVLAMVSCLVASRLQSGEFQLAAMLANVVAAPAHLIGLVEALTGHHSRWVPTHHGLPQRRRNRSVLVLGALALLNFGATLVGLATGAARAGYAAGAAFLNLAAAQDLWVVAPLMLCAIQTTVFVLPLARAASAIRRLPFVFGGTAAAFLLLTILLTPSSPASSPVRPTLETTWREDFNGPAGQLPDPSAWLIDEGHHYPGGPPNWGTGEIQAYVRSNRNLHLDGNGHLIITATHEPDGQYLSGRIESRRADLLPPAHGTLRIEARVKLPSSRGAWATFWALGSSFRNDLRWPESGEIDIIEYRGALPDEVYGVLHCPHCGLPVGKRSRYTDTEGLANQFHVYTVDWHDDPDRIDWYVDGRLYQSIQREALDPRSWVFEQPAFLLLNLAVGGEWPGGPAPEDYPAHMKVDYVETRTCLGACPPLSTEPAVPALPQEGEYAVSAKGGS